MNKLYKKYILLPVYNRALFDIINESGKDEKSFKYRFFRYKTYTIAKDNIQFYKFLNRHNNIHEKFNF